MRIFEKCTSNQRILIFSLLKLSLVSVGIIILSCCSSWKECLVSSGGQNEAVDNAILDFVNSSSLSKKDSVFNVSIEKVNNETIGISISGSINRVYLTPEIKIGTSISYFPTKFIEKKNKLFLFHDSTIALSNEMLLKLSEYNQIDTVNGLGDMILATDDSKKAVVYYFCKDNILNYKKVTTSIAMGWYSPPKLNCSEGN